MAFHVEIKRKDGKVLSRRVDYPRGHPKNPMTMEDIAAKFRDCASYSIKPVSKVHTEKVIDMLINLEQVDDIRQIIQLIS